MSPRTKTILYRILTTIIYITSLFFISYILANCIIVNFNRENLFIAGVMCVSSLFYYSCLSYMNYCTKNNEFKDDADKYGVMLLMSLALQGIPMLCYILSLLIGIGVPK